jgi:hypothetical protein
MWLREGVSQLRGQRLWAYDPAVDPDRKRTTDILRCYGGKCGSMVRPHTREQVDGEWVTKCLICGHDREPSDAARDGVQR